MRDSAVARNSSEPVERAVEVCARVDWVGRTDCRRGFVCSDWCRRHRVPLVPSLAVAERAAGVQRGAIATAVGVCRGRPDPLGPANTCLLSPRSRPTAGSVVRKRGCRLERTSSTRYTRVVDYWRPLGMGRCVWGSRRGPEAEFLGRWGYRLCIVSLRAFTRAPNGFDQTDRSTARGVGHFFRGRCIGMRRFRESCLIAALFAVALASSPASVGGDVCGGRHAR